MCYENFILNLQSLGLIRQLRLGGRRMLNMLEKVMGLLMLILLITGKLRIFKMMMSCMSPIV